jgi:hypothetical protein
MKTLAIQQCRSSTFRKFVGEDSQRKRKKKRHEERKKDMSE